MVKNQCGTMWYRNRFKALIQMGILTEDDFKRQLVFAKWTVFLRESFGNLTTRDIAKVSGMGISAISIDLHRVGLAGYSSVEKVIPKDTRPFSDDPYKFASELFSYDAETGVVTRDKVNSVQFINRVGEPVESACVSIKKKSLSLRQLAWLLHTRKLPVGSIKTIDGSKCLKFDNMRLVHGNSVDGVDKSAFKEKVVILGRVKMMDVEQSKSSQPKNIANRLRMAGVCQKCRHYLPRCLEREMLVNCIASRDDIAMWSNQDKMFELEKSQTNC